MCIYLNVDQIGASLLPQMDTDARISSQALSEIESRHQDIICLESSIKELHEIFTDTAMLLEIQVRWLPHLEMFYDVRNEGIFCLEIQSWLNVRLMSVMFFFYQGELINNIEKNVTSAAEYVDKSKAETQKAVAYKKNPYKIASLPNFLKPFKKHTTAKSSTDQNTPDLNCS